MKNKISIIIPFYNRNNTVERCLESIKSTIYEIEIIIIDDGSDFKLNDNLCSLYPIKVISLKSNVGAVAARSVGADIASGEYLLFLDSDDELTPHWDSTLSNVISDECDIYGFPSIEYNNYPDYLIQSSFDYWLWVSNKNRAPDYWLFMKRSRYISLPMPKLRISELWYICQIFDNVSKVHFSKFPIFKYHQDAGNQLTKIKKIQFNSNAHDISSLRYSINIFLNNAHIIKKNAPDHFYAWKRRFIKECILSFQFNLIPKIFFI
jgi:glycosyltransferase involved in cell wall biosynthesis